MAVIDSDNFITHLVYGGIIDKATCGELRKAIELCTVKDIYTKSDVITILTELQQEIENTVKEEELIDEKWAKGLHYSEKIIQQKINELKENAD